MRLVFRGIFQQTILNNHALGKIGAVVSLSPIIFGIIIVLFSKRAYEVIMRN